MPGVYVCKTTCRGIQDTYPGCDEQVSLVVAAQYVVHQTDF